jgi:hypothetical protein
MKRAMMVVIPVVLAGCAMSPVDLREEGRRAESESSKSPREATQCITRNAETYKPLGALGAAFTAYWRESLKPGSFEVLVPHPAQGKGYLLIADISPRDSGSQITTWLNPNFVFSMDDAVIAGCK